MRKKTRNSKKVDKELENKYKHLKTSESTFLKYKELANNFFDNDNFKKMPLDEATQYMRELSFLLRRQRNQGLKEIFYDSEKH